MFAGHLLLSYRAFEGRDVPYQDGAAICYQELQGELLRETGELPLQRHFTISDQELDDYLDKERPTQKRSWLQPE